MEPQVTEAGRLALSAGEFAMFGYGSLLWKRSMELTLGKPYLGPRPACTIRGWRRTWDVMMPNRSFYTEAGGTEITPDNIVYLNVSRSPETLLNGVLYVITAEQMAQFDSREWIYDRITVTKDLVDLTVEGGDVALYVGKNEYRVPLGSTFREAAIRQSYIEIVNNGLKDLGDDFAAKYSASTDTPPPELIVCDHKRDGNPILASSSSELLGR